MPAITTLKTGAASDTTLWPGGVLPTIADDVTIGRYEIACTVNNVTDIITAVAHGLVNGQKVAFVASVLPTGITATENYFISDATADTFRVKFDNRTTSVGDTMGYPNITSNGTNVRVTTPHVVTLDTALAMKTLTINGDIEVSQSVSSSLTVAGLITVNEIGQFDCLLTNDYTKKFDLILNQAQVASQLCLNSKMFVDKFRMKGYPKKRHTRLDGAIAIGSYVASFDDVSGWQNGDIIAFGSTSSTGLFTTSEWRTVQSIAGLDVTFTTPSTYAYQDRAYIGNMSSNVTVRSFGTTQAAAASINITVGYEVPRKIKELTNLAFHYLGASNSACGLTIQSLNGQSDSVKGINDNAFFQSWGGALSLYMGTTYLPCERNVFYSDNTHSTVSYNRHLSLPGNGSSKDSSIKENLFLKLLQWNAVEYANTGYILMEDNISCGNNFTWSSDTFPFSDIRGQTVSVSPGVLKGMNFTGLRLNQEFGYSGPATIADIRYMGVITWKDCILPEKTMFVGYWPGNYNVIGAPDSARLKVINRNQDPTRHEIYTNQSVTPTFVRDNAVFHRSNSSLKYITGKFGVNMPYTQDILVANGETIRVIGYVRTTAAFYNGGAWTPPKVRLSGLGLAPVEFVASAACVNAWEKYDISITNTSGLVGSITLGYDVRALSVLGDVWFDGVPDYPMVEMARHYGFVFDEASKTRTADPYKAVEEQDADYTGITINGATERITFSAGTGDTSQKFYDFTRLWSCENLGYQVPLSRSGSLYSLADGWTVVEPTYTGLTWGGGVVEFSAPGAKTINADASALRFTTAGTYSLAGSMVDVDLVNTSGGAVTVQVPASATYINIGPNITVEQAQASRSIIGLPDGAEVRLVRGSFTVAHQQDVSGGTYTYAYAPDNLPVDVRVTLPGHVFEPLEIVLGPGDQSVPITYGFDPSYLI